MQVFPFVFPPSEDTRENLDVSGRSAVRRVGKTALMWQRRPRGPQTPTRLLSPLVAAILVLLLSFPAGGCSRPARDANEPNDDLEQATVLVPGAEIEGAFSPPRNTEKDTDIFRVVVDGEGPVNVVVTLSGDTAEEAQLQMGIVTPDGPEGIMWPGWQREETVGMRVLRGTVNGPATLIVLLEGRGGHYTLSAVVEAAE